MKRIFTLLLALSLIIGSSGLTAKAETVVNINGNHNKVIFIDVPDTYWAKKDIDYFAEQGIVVGTGEISLIQREK